MTNMMKAVVWNGKVYPNCLTYEDYQIPEPPDGWVRVKNIATGICGTDVHFVLGDTSYLVPKENFPAVLGHEFSGIVDQVGEGVQGFTPGDRVAVEPILSCTIFGSTCPMCETGKYQLCQKGLTHVGVPITRMIPGGFGDYSIVPESRLFHIPENVTFEEAALLDILAVDVHAVNVGNPHMGLTAAVMGCGIIGLDMIQCLKVEGITDIIAIAKYDNQAVLAKQLGAKEVIVLHPGVDASKEVKRITGGWGVDQVYECVGGMTDAVAQSVAMCGQAGQVIMLGGSSKPMPVDLQDMLLKEVNILSSNSYSTAGKMREFQIAMNLLRDRLVNHSTFVTHRFSPSGYQEAFNTAIHKGKHNAIKVMFTREY